MADSHLKLNEEKTQIIWLGTRQQLNKLSSQHSSSDSSKRHGPVFNCSQETLVL